MYSDFTINLYFAIYMGLKEIDIVDGYRISLHENIDGSTLDNSDYSYDEVKKM